MPFETNLYSQTRGGGEGLQNDAKTHAVYTSIRSVSFHCFEIWNHRNLITDSLKRQGWIQHKVSQGTPSSLRLQLGHGLPRQLVHWSCRQGDDVLCGHVCRGGNGDKFPENILGHFNIVMCNDQCFLNVLIWVSLAHKVLNLTGKLGRCAGATATLLTTPSFSFRVYPPR